MQHQTGVRGQRRPGRQCDGHAARSGRGRNECGENGRYGQKATAKEDPPVAACAGRLPVAASSFTAQRNARGSRSCGSQDHAYRRDHRATDAAVSERSQHVADGSGNQTSSAWTLVAEVGPTVEAFPTAADLVSWAGICPGNNKTAGKRKSGTTRAGNPWLRRALCEAAWAASKSKGTYLQAQFRRLAALRGGVSQAGASRRGQFHPYRWLLHPATSHDVPRARL